MKHTFLNRGIVGPALICLMVFVTWLLATPQTQGPTQEEQRVEDAILVFREIAGLADEGIPEAIFRKAYGVAIIPGVVKAAYGIGGEYGRGVLLVQDKEEWSNPSFITLAGGSLGWQIGIQRSDLVLVFRTRKSIDHIAEGKVTLGADASVAAGPVGRGAQANTDLEVKAEIYAYSRAKGLFIGVSVKGAAIQIDADANQRFYRDPQITAQRIFTDFSLAGRPVSERLREVLAKFLSSGYKI